MDVGSGCLVPTGMAFSSAGRFFSYPKTTVVFTFLLAVIIIMGLREVEQRRLIADEQAKKDQSKKDATLTSQCLSKYKTTSRVPASEQDCLILLDRYEAKHRDEELTQARLRILEDNSSILTAEWACRRAVKDSLKTTDGYHIPFGSVVTSRLAGEPGKYITKFPFTVKNYFGVNIKHGVECVATGDGTVTMVNLLY